MNGTNRMGDPGNDVPEAGDDTSDVHVYVSFVLTGLVHLITNRSMLLNDT
jgi:hypothetical protein